MSILKYVSSSCFCFLFYFLVPVKYAAEFELGDLLATKWDMDCRSKYVNEMKKAEDTKIESNHSAENQLSDLVDSSIESSISTSIHLSATENEQPAYDVLLAASRLIQGEFIIYLFVYPFHYMFDLFFS